MFASAIIPLISAAILLFLPTANKEVKNIVSLVNIIILICKIFYNLFSLKPHNQWNCFSLLILNYVDSHHGDYTKEEYDQMLNKLAGIATGLYTSFKDFKTPT